MASLLTSCLQNLVIIYIMQTKLLYLSLLLFVFACSGVKQANKALYSGDYEKAIEVAVNRLQKNKNKKADQEQVAILENAFAKMKTTYKDRISFLEKGFNVDTQEIYNLYLRMDNAQHKIKPLLPLYKASGMQADFAFEDFSDQIVQAKQDYVNSLYDEGVRLSKGSKQDNRKAYNTFGRLLDLYPNYKDVKRLQQEARYKGTDFVYVVVENHTNVVIPVRLEETLLDFNTYGLDDFWTAYHASQVKGQQYDYEVVLEFREIAVSPERLSEKEVLLEREIVETTYRTDRNGNYILDERGNKIREETKTIVKGKLNQVIQTKSVGVAGQVHYFDLQRGQRTNSYPLQSEFIFENVFAEFTGDKKVLNKDEEAMIRNRFVPFPSNEQMLFDASNDIKSRFASILKRYKFS